MSHLLIDGYGRRLNYLRFSVIDKCNLRCKYCMPANGLKWIQQDDLATTSECLRMLKIFHQCGITKIRFTGGEPFVRPDFQKILTSIAEENWFEQIHITTNGTLGKDIISSLPKGLITGINLSLDSLIPESYYAITRRDALGDVMDFFELIQQLKIPTKINVVVMEGLNHDEILSMLAWAKNYPIELRFIEEMPFNGSGTYAPTSWNFSRIREIISTEFPQMEPLPFGLGDTSQRYRIAGFKATVGIIAAWSRSFCGQCNRIRLTASGQIRTCLYAQSGYSMLHGMRAGASDDEIIQTLLRIVKDKAKDGFAAEHKESQHPSMAHIGG